MDSTKLLTEKLSLSREISALKPELDYLRSQAVSHQSTLTEKLNLQQQCTALQAELDSARRSAQRANAKEGRLQTEENKYKDQIDALNRELAAERKERQRIERESAQFAAESQAKNEVMVSRLDAFRTKLKSTKEQLKEAQENAKLAQITNNETHDFRRPEKPGPGPCGGLRKRKAGMIEPDTTVGTPGDAPAAKRGKRTSTLPGDKSMFSTTPFLNRTMSVAPESPNSDRAQSPIVSANEQAIPSARRVEIQRDPAPPATASGPGEQAPNMSTSNVKGRKSSLNPTRQTQAPSRKPLVSTTLELVAEESDGQAISRETVGNAKITIEAKKKKRKLLGNNMSKTLFDEDGGEAASLKRGIGGYSRPMKALGRNTLGSGIGVVKLGVMEPTTGVGGFSPLKKDRRAGTSFIG